MVIYPVDTVIQRLHNWALMCVRETNCNLCCIEFYFFFSRWDVKIPLFSAKLASCMRIHYYQVPSAHFRIFSHIYLLCACVVLFCRFISHVTWSWLWPGSVSGWIVSKQLLGLLWGSPLYSPWQRWLVVPGPPCQRSPTSNPSNGSWWCVFCLFSPPFWNMPLCHTWCSKIEKRSERGRSCTRNMTMWVY